MEKPDRSFWQIWNMSFGFLGIQFGWGLQMANMSAIYEYLGARADQIPVLWLAAPLTGLLVQPMIGRASDRTWNRLGRRRPYFLAGAILSSMALILMPRSSTLWMAASLLWILDASINVSMEPFRAFVADLLPERQRTRGFAMQSLFIGLGAVIASALPFLLTNLFGMSLRLGSAAIPATVRISFYIGAAAFLGAVLWTIVTTPEYPPEDVEQFHRTRSREGGLGGYFHDIVASIGHMPATMRQLAWVQIFTWLGLFCMWLYFGVAIARSVFHAASPDSPGYQQGIEWGGFCFAAYSAVCFAFSFVLPGIAARLGRKSTHAICLLCGATGLLSVGVIQNKYLLLLSMTGVGIAWCSTLAMPYSILAEVLPEGKTGVYMGIFNFFIVIPEIVASLFLGSAVNALSRHLPGGIDIRLAVVMAGGLFLILASALVSRIQEAKRALAEAVEQRA